MAEIQYLTIKQAAEFLGVTPLTLRNWDKAGKLKAKRHPMSNYRLYALPELKLLVAEIESGAVPVRSRHKSRKRKLPIRSVK